jgi:hypothetical protein
MLSLILLSANCWHSQLESRLHMRTCQTQRNMTRKSPSISCACIYSILEIRVNETCKTCEVYKSDSCKSVWYVCKHTYIHTFKQMHPYVHTNLRTISHEFNFFHREHTITTLAADGTFERVPGQAPKITYNQVNIHPSIVCVCVCFVCVFVYVCLFVFMYACMHAVCMY